MKTERRHELQSNQLAEILTDVGEKAKPYAKGLLGLALAALVIVCAYLYLSNRAKAEEVASWDQAWQAIATGNQEELRNIIKAYPNKPAALWSQLVLADMELNRGVSNLFTQKSTGRDLIRTASEDYQYVADHAVHPLLREHALFGVGRAQESLDQLPKARDAYEQLLKTYPDGPYARRAQQRLDELARDSTKSWYDWFATTEPTPSNFGKGSDLSNPFDEKGSSGPSLGPLPPGFVLPDTDKSKAPPSEPKPDQPKGKSDESKTESGKGESPNLDAGKTQETKPGDAKTDAPKESDSKAGETKPPESKPVEAKPNASPKLDAPKSATSKPEPAKSAAGKTESAK